jgi:hypothetical protein
MKKELCVKLVIYKAAKNVYVSFRDVSNTAYDCISIHVVTQMW